MKTGQRSLHHIDEWCTEPRNLIYRLVRLQLLLKFYYHSSTSNSESQFQVLTFQVQVQVLGPRAQVLKNRTGVWFESKSRTRVLEHCWVDICGKDVNSQQTTGILVVSLCASLSSTAWQCILLHASHQQHVSEAAQVSCLLNTLILSRFW